MSSIIRFTFVFALTSAFAIPVVAADMNELRDSIDLTVVQNPTLLNSKSLSNADKGTLAKIIRECTELLSMNPSKELKIWTLDVKVKALFTLHRIVQVNSLEQYNDYENSVIEYEKITDRKEIVNVVKRILYTNGLKLLLDTTVKDSPNPYKLKASICQFISENFSNSDDLAKHLIETARVYAKHDNQFAVETYKEVGEIYAKSKFKDESTLGAKWIAVSNRYNLVGKPFKFSGLDINGKSVTSDKFKNKVVLVDFWATWCGPCIKGLPQMKEMYANLNNKGFEIVGINVESNLKTVEDFIKKEKLPWTIILDSSTAPKGSKKISDVYGIDNYPTMILIGKDGNVVATDIDLTTARRESFKQLGSPISMVGLADEPKPLQPQTQLGKQNWDDIFTPVAP